MHTSSNSS